MRPGRFFPVLLLAAEACTPPGPEGAETIEQPIVAGTADTGDPSIIELFAVGGNEEARCTATVVTPKVLLTAGHCIFETKGFRYGVFLGDDDRMVTGKDLLAVATAKFDPAYNNNPSNGHDLAVVVMAEPLSLKPIPMNRTPLGLATDGKMARVVGYGLNNGVKQTGSGVKREATSPIAQVATDLIRIAANPHGTCNGDSGGPLLMDTGSGTESIVGVVSFGVDATCLRDSYYQRLDTQIAWVDEVIKQYDPTGAVGIPDGGGGPAADGGAGADDAGGPGATGDASVPPTPDAAPTPPPPTPDAAPIPPVLPPDAAPAPPADASTRSGSSDGSAPKVMNRMVTGGCGCDLGHSAPGSGLLALAAGALVLARLRRRPRRQSSR